MSMSHRISLPNFMNGYESDYLLERIPDAGHHHGNRIGCEKVFGHPWFRNLNERTENSGEKIHKFTRGHFYGSFNFDVDKTLHLFIAGRCETLAGPSESPFQKQFDRCLRSSSSLFCPQRPTISTWEFYAVMPLPINSVTKSYHNSNVFHTSNDKQHQSTVPL